MTEGEQLGVDHRDWTPTPEISEYSYDAGLEVALSRIKELAENQEYVVVAINGVAPDVGKTRLTADIMENLMESEIPAVTEADDYQLDYIVDDLRSAQQNYAKEGGVILLNAFDSGSMETEELLTKLKKMKDSGLAKRAKEIGLPLNKIDFWIALQRPDKKFRSDQIPLGDILITNEKAEDKNSRYRQFAA